MHFTNECHVPQKDDRQGRPAEGRRVPPLGFKKVRRDVSLSRDQLAYLLRLAREKGAGNVSGEVGKAVAARRRLRHDLRGQLNALRLTADCLRRDLYTPQETLEALDAISADMAGLID